jgi:hypothetical protein
VLEVVQEPQPARPLQGKPREHEDGDKPLHGRA